MYSRHCHEIWTTSIQEIEQLLAKSDSIAVNGSHESSVRKLQSCNQLHPLQNTNLSLIDYACILQTAAFCEIYARYIQILKNLSTLHAYIRQPQQREIVCRAIEYCALLLSDTWFALVKSNKLVDVIDFGQTLESLQLTCDDLDIPMLGMLRQRTSSSTLQHSDRTSNSPAPDAAINTASTVVSSSTTAFSSVPSNVVQRQLRREADLGSLRKGAMDELRNVEGCALRLQEQERVSRWLQCHIDTSAGRWPINIPLKGDLPIAASQPTHESLVASEKKTSKKADAITKKGKPNSNSASATFGATRDISLVESPTLPAILDLRAEFNKLSSKWNRINKGTLARHKDHLLGVDNSDILDSLPLPRRGSSIDAVQFDVLADDLRPAVIEEIQMDVRSEAIKRCEDANARVPVIKQAKSENQPASKQKKALSIQSKETTSNNSSPTSSNVVGVNIPSKREESNSSATASTGLIDPLNAKDHNVLLLDLKACGILREPVVDTPISDFLGESFLVHPQIDLQSHHVKKVRAGGKTAHAAESKEEPVLPYPPLSLAGVRQLVTVQCIYPLLTFSARAALLSAEKVGASSASSTVTAAATKAVSMLIHGPPKSGKTMLTMAIARESGSFIFDLSPSVIAGKFPGDEIESIVRTVFVAAKRTSPSIIYIDDVEKVFIMDKTRSMAFTPPGGEPPCRIRKQLLIEIASLTPYDGVFVISNSSNPQACVGNDEKEMIDAFPVLIRMPLPDHRSRRAILETMCENYGCYLDNDTCWCSPPINNEESPHTLGDDVLHVAACMLEGYTAGTIIQCMENSLDTWKQQQQQQQQSVHKAQFLDYFAEAVAAIHPVNADGMMSGDMGVAHVDTTEISNGDWTAHAHAIQQKKVSAAEITANDTGAVQDDESKRKLKKKVRN